MCDVLVEVVYDDDLKTTYPFLPCDFDMAEGFASDMWRLPGVVDVRIYGGDEVG